MTTISPEVDALAPDSSEITLEDGTRVLVQRLRTRQMFKLLKVLTHGAGGLLTTLTFGGDQEQFITELLALTVISIPNAEDEAIEFVRSMVESADAIEKPRSKGDRERNQTLRESLDAYLDNPGLDDLISIIEVVIRTEGPEMVALGKRLGALIQTTTGTAAVAPAPEAEPEKPKRSSRAGSKA